MLSKIIEIINAAINIIIWLIFLFILSIIFFPVAIGSFIYQTFYEWYIRELRDIE